MAYRRRRGKKLAILNLSTRWRRRVVNFTLQPLYPWERAPVPIE